MKMPAVIRTVAVLLLVASGARGDDEPRVKGFAPEARRLFAAVVETYRTMPGVDIEGTIVSEWTVDRRPRRQERRTLLRHAPPSKLVLANGPARIVRDGTTLRSVFETYRQYATSDAPAEVGSAMLRGHPLAGPLVGGLEGFPLFLLLELVTEKKEAEAVLTLGAGGMMLEDGRELDGSKVRSLLVDWPQGTGFRLLVDPQSKHVRRIEMLHALEMANAQAPRQAPRLETLSITWSATKVNVAVPADDAFAYSPPQGYTKVTLAALLERPLAPSEVRMPAQTNERVMREMEAARAMVGKATPEFQVTVLDAAGQERPLGRGDLEGRVAALVVWPGSLDEPFPGELAGVAAMAGAYGEAKAGVTVVFLLHDNLAADADAMRGQVKRAIERRMLRLPAGEHGLTAIDPELSVARAFHVIALPTVVVLDARGIVRAVHMGFMEKHAAPIKRDIDKLLDSAGK